MRHCTVIRRGNDELVIRAEIRPYMFVDIEHRQSLNDWQLYIGIEESVQSDIKNRQHKHSAARSNDDAQQKKQDDDTNIVLRCRHSMLGNFKATLAT